MDLITLWNIRTLAKILVSTLERQVFLDDIDGEVGNHQCNLKFQLKIG